MNISIGSAIVQKEHRLKMGKKNNKQNEPDRCRLHRRFGFRKFSSSTSTLAARSG